MIASSSTALVNGGESAANTETIIVTTPVCEVPRDSIGVIIVASARILTGTTATAFTMNIRRGNALTSTLVLNNANIAVGASQIIMPIVTFFEFLLLQATAQYSLTFTGVGEGTGSTWNNACISAWFLS